MPDSWPTARELMTPNPPTLSTEAPLSKALGLMRSAGVHEVPILRNGRLVGLMTFDAIARRTNLALSTKVEHVMTLPPVVTPDTAYPELAEQLLTSGLRGLPVIGKKGELIGTVSRSDLVKVLPDLTQIADHRVEEVASPVGLVLREHDACGVLFPEVRLLEQHALPVTDTKGRVVGAVGLADLGRVLWRPRPPGKRDARASGRYTDITVGTIMRSPALTVERGSSIAAAARAMTKAKVSSVFLVEDNRPTGVLSQADLLGLVVGRGETSLRKPEDVYVQVHGLRASGDPEVLTEIDRLVGRSLGHISRYAHPTLLSINVTPHSARTGDATVHIRLQTDRGIFYASATGWNFFASITSSLDEIQSQVRRLHEAARGKVRGHHRRAPEALDIEVGMPVDQDIEEKIRAATGLDDSKA
jgi:CBS domain-containing protein/ribosome-associated translation inhibitor RaiA